VGADAARQREVWAREGLSSRERRLVAIACVGFACTAEPIVEQLHAAFEGREFTVDEMLEVVLHFAVYCGWPKASNLEMYVRQTWARIQEERGEEVQPLPLRPTDSSELGPNDWEARVSRGEQEFRDVNHVPAPGRDSPYQHAGILNFVFGHVWQRPGLGRRDRRFLTVACVGVDEAPLPILSHVGSALQSGDITRAEMEELILTFRAYDNDTRADALQAAVESPWPPVIAPAR
jgi:4-carboxymuconolactone decarboxylase